MKWTVPLLALPLVSACVPTGPARIEPAPQTPPVICAGWKPIFLREVTIDALDDGEIEAILGHNEYGETQRCW